MADRVDIERASEITGYSKGHLMRLIREGKGPKHIKMGRRYWFFESDLEDWIMSFMVEPKQ